jgi:hypothetical protein
MADLLQGYAANIVGNPDDLKTTYIRDKKTGVVRVGSPSSATEQEKAIAPEELPGVKHRTAGEFAQVQGRGIANSLTLGGYAAISDRFQSPEELQDIRERGELYHNSKMIGEIAPYLFTGAAGVVGKTLGFVPGLGGKVAGALFADAAEQGVLTGASKLMTHFAIDGATQAFSSGIGEASLDNFSKESMNSALMNTVVGGGAVLGFGVGGLAPYARKALSSGEPGKTGVVDFTAPQAMSDSQNVTKSVAENRMALSDLGNKTSALASRDPATLTAEESLDLKFGMDYLKQLGNNKEKLIDYTDQGLMGRDLKTDIDASRDALQMEVKYGEGRPINKPLKNLSTSTNDMTDQYFKYWRDVDANRLAFDPKALNTELNASQQAAIDMRIASGDESLYRKTKSVLENIISPKSNQAAMASSAIDTKYAKDLLLALEGSAEKSGILSAGTSERAALESAAAKRFDEVFAGASDEVKRLSRPKFMEQLVPKDIQQGMVPDAASKAWDFLETFRKEIGSVYSNKLLRNPAEKALYAQIREETRQGFAGLGDKALKYAEVTDSFSRVKQAIDDVKTALGKPIRSKKVMLQAGKRVPPKDAELRIPDDYFTPLRSFNESTGKLSNENVRPALENLQRTISDEVQKLQANSGISAERVLPSVESSGSRALEFHDDIRKMTNASSQRWYKMQKNINKRGEMGPSEEPSHESTIKKALNFGKDIVTGNVSSIANKTMGLAIDTASKLLSRTGTDEAMTKLVAKSQDSQAYTDHFLTQMEQLKQAQSAANNIKLKSENLVSSLTLLDNTPRSALRIVPYSGIANTLQGREKIQKEYKKVTDNLVGFGADPDNTPKFATKMQSLNHLSAGLGDEMNVKALTTISFLSKMIPPNISLTQGGGPPSVIEQAKFLDTVDAVTQPMKIIDLLKGGTITSDQLKMSQQMNPELHMYMAQKLTDELIKKPDLDVRQRTRIKSLFPMVDSVTMPAPGVTPLPQNVPMQHKQPGDQVPGTAMPKISGMKHLDANKTFGTFTSLGGTGSR